MACKLDLQIVSEDIFGSKVCVSMPFGASVDINFSLHRILKGCNQSTSFHEETSYRLDLEHRLGYPKGTQDSTRFQRYTVLGLAGIVIFRY
jgi:hypothetical protein